MREEVALRRRVGPHDAPIGPSRHGRIIRHRRSSKVGGRIGNPHQRHVPDRTTGQGGNVQSAGPYNDFRLDTEPLEVELLIGS